jgi:hypothetical protein
MLISLVTVSGAHRSVQTRVLWGPDFASLCNSYTGGRIDIILNLRIFPIKPVSVKKPHVWLCIVGTPCTLILACFNTDGLRGYSHDSSTSLLPEGMNIFEMLGWLATVCHSMSLSLTSSETSQIYWEHKPLEKLSMNPFWQSISFMVEIFIYSVILPKFQMC